VTARASDSMFYALTLCELQIVFTIKITLNSTYSLADRSLSRDQAMGQGSDS